MGRRKSEVEQTRPMEITELKAVKVVGRGAMGTVFLVQRDGCHKPLALKAMSKSALAKKGDGLRRAHIERDILSMLDHPFLPALVGHVETDKIVGWVVDFCPGGDLNALRLQQTEKMFSESIIRFYAAEIVLALEHLHEQGIVYRDLKPENVLIQANGHIMLTDFDLSTRLSPIKKQEQKLPDLGPPEVETVGSNQRRATGRLDTVVSYLRKAASTRPSAAQVSARSSARVSPNVGKAKKDKTNGGVKAAPSAAAASGRLNSFVGTEEYVAPEVVRGTGHEFGVDWWAMGILLYEMLYGETPFKGSSRRETFFKILVKEPQFMGPWTPLRDLIQRLLDKEPQSRLGSCNGACEVKNHGFFEGLDWQGLQDVSRPPFVPPVVPVQAKGGIAHIEDCVEKLEMELFEDKLSARSEDCRDEAPQNWVERLSRTGQADVFGMY